MTAEDMYEEWKRSVVTQLRSVAGRIESGDADIVEFNVERDTAVDEETEGLRTVRHIYYTGLEEFRISVRGRGDRGWWRMS